MIQNTPPLPKLIFMGTPVFAVPALRALYEAGYPLAAVYSQPPKPVGRGYKLAPSPVHMYAESVGIPVYTPKTLRTPEAEEVFRSHGADLAIVAAYGLILPRGILEVPAYGCLNIHGSILPRWRGAAPIQRSILAGDTETGITIMKMDEGLDTGPMLTKAFFSITKTATSQELHDELSTVGAELLLKTIPGYLEGSIPLLPQPEEGVTYAHKLLKEESRLDWRRSAAELDCQIRGLFPWPGTYMIHNDAPLKVLKARVVSSPDPLPLPGTALDDRLTIACGQGALRIEALQKPGSKGLSADEFLRGYPIPQGTVFPCPDTN